MSQARRHVIRRECIDLAVEGGESDGFALQGQLAALCQGELAAALDQAFSRAAPGDEHWQFERIEVDVGNFTPETFARDFAATVAAAVEEQLRTRTPRMVAEPELAVADTGDARMSGAQSVHQALLYFLATGVLPWWFRLPEGRTLEAVVSEAWGAVPAEPGSTAAPPRVLLLRALAAPAARWRLARQFSTGWLERLLEQLAPGAPAVLREVVSAVRREAPAAVAEGVPEQAWVAAFACLAVDQAITPTPLVEAWAAIAPELLPAGVAERVARASASHGGTPAPPQHGGTEPAGERPAMTSDHPAKKHDTQAAAATQPAVGVAPMASIATATKALDLQEGSFVDCAGLVLLHPFLPQLFERRGVAADGELVQPDRALALLHFLATGQASAPEHALLLPKLLCGMEPSAVAGAPVELSEEDRGEAESLLQAAISHWGALGEATPDALRGNFLVRPGKLSSRGDDDRLQVERQAWDLLLGRLPWGIGVVRLPWMRRMLWVEWTY